MTGSSPDRGGSGCDGPIALAIAGLVLATVVIGTLGPPSTPAPAKPAAALLPENDPNCLEWGDGCHVCRRRPEGDACSLPGIACTPGPVACLERGKTP